MDEIGAEIIMKKILFALMISMSSTMALAGLRPPTNSVITFTATTATISGLVGTTTNDSAFVGNIGQYVSSATIVDGFFPTSTQWGDLAQISLTAGDWDVSATLNTTTNGATVTEFILGISTTTGNSSAGLTKGDNQADVLDSSITSDFRSLVVPAYRLSLATSATAFLKYNAAYSVATPKATGRISARRVR
jgi:hypothetical protein